MPAGATSTGDRDGQSGLRRIEWGKRHSLGSSEADEADADNEGER